jgi:UDP-glucose 4-epimerase
VKNRSRLRYDLLLTLWPLGKYTHWLSKLPLLGRFLAGQTSAKTNEAIILPGAPARSISVRHKIETKQNVALPYPLLAPLVENASARTILNECPCRRAERCANYPRDLGCLFLGDGAAQIHAELGREATPAEALAHVERAMEAGLVPTILHSCFDAYLLDIPYRRMLAICFCCDCCCTVRHSIDVDAPGFRETVVRLPGLNVEVGPACTGCGRCIATCPVQAISLHASDAQTAPDVPSGDGTSAVIDPERCKGCGRCLAICPTSAIHLHLPKPTQTLEHLQARISRRTDIRPMHLEPSTDRLQSTRSSGQA